MATTANFNARINARKAKELVLKREHIEIKDLKLRDVIKQEKIVTTYLSKDIPDYPTPVEFHITEVAHVTNKEGLPGILDSEGFKGLDQDSFSWWNLKITEADITAAEERFLDSFLTNSSKEQRAAQQPFLRNFTTSPLFHEISRYGNFRFTFPVTELMEAYKVQECDGEEPVLRVYGTKLFKQEIEYVVLVHSPRFNGEFGSFPKLASSPLVAYDGKQIIWKAQAICETHNFQLERHEDTAVTKYMYSHLFYVWDQVSFAFHTGFKKILTFPKRMLKENLSFCEIDPGVDLSKQGSFSSLPEAKKFCESLPEYELEKDEKDENDENDVKENKSGEIKMEEDLPLVSS